MRENEQQEGENDFYFAVVVVVAAVVAEQLLVEVVNLLKCLKVILHCLNLKVRLNLQHQLNNQFRKVIIKLY